MYILMISRGIPTKQYPLWGCFEKDQAEALASIGHKVVVASVDSRFLFKFRKIGLTHTTINNIEYYNHFLIPSALLDIVSHKLCIKARELEMKQLFNQILKTHGKPDIIYGHFFSNTLLGVQISQKYNIPLVGIEHAGRFNEPTLKNWKYTQKDAQYAYLNANAVIAVSKSLKQSLTRHFAISPSVVHNLVGREFTYIPQTTSHPFTFISTGRLVPSKGFNLLPIAFSKVKDILPPNWQLIIIGGGKEQTNLQQQINESGLQDHIRLVGQKTKQEIVQIYNNSDIYVSASYSETFGVAILEALACGLPAISTICGGPEEFITEHNGILVPVNDIDALAEAIKTMYINRDTYDHRAIADDCQARFSPQVIARQLTDIFQQVIDQYSACK